ncbi:MAG: GTPase ObgE, partial [Candidatus Rokuibacteriota bacterium]
IAANKIDLTGAAPRLRSVHALGRRRGLPVVPISARTGGGLAELRAAIAALLDASPGGRRARALG